MGDLPIDPAPMVDLLEEEPLEVELASTLIYEHSHYPYRQIRQAVKPPAKSFAARSSTWDFVIAAVTTKCCGLSAPGSNSASIS